MLLQKVNIIFKVQIKSLFEYYFFTVLVGLYEEPERPQNAVDYIKRYMGAPTGIDVEALKSECEQLRKDKTDLENQVRELNNRLNEGA